MNNAEWDNLSQADQLHLETLATMLQDGELTEVEALDILEQKQKELF